MEHLKAIIEAIVFVSETPISAKKLKEIIEDVGEKEIEAVLQALVREYDERKGGFLLVEVAEGYQFRTREEFGQWIKKLKGVKLVTLSRAAMETLAVVAYRQPIMKSEVEKVRGVDVSSTLKGLLEKNLVRIVGRKDVPGKPIIYGTTRKFLEVFNLRDLSELPTLRELKELGE